MKKIELLRSSEAMKILAWNEELNSDGVTVNEIGELLIEYAIYKLGHYSFKSPIQVAVSAFSKKGSTTDTATLIRNAEAKINDFYTQQRSQRMAEYILRQDVFGTVFDNAVSAANGFEDIKLLATVLCEVTADKADVNRRHRLMRLAIETLDVDGIKKVYDILFPHTE